MEGMFIVFFVSIIISFLTSLTYRFGINHEEHKKLKAEMKNLRKNISRAQKKNNQKEIKKLTGRMLELSNLQLRSSVKPMLFSIILILPVFWAFGSMFSGPMVTLPFSVPFLGSTLEWLGWYILLSIAFTTLFRRLLEIE